jgi:hypothetical protein
MRLALLHVADPAILETLQGLEDLEALVDPPVDNPTPPLAADPQVGPAGHGAGGVAGGDSSGWILAPGSGNPFPPPAADLHTGSWTPKGLVHAAGCGAVGGAHGVPTGFSVPCSGNWRPPTAADLHAGSPTSTVPVDAAGR